MSETKQSLYKAVRDDLATIPEGLVDRAALFRALAICTAHIVQAIQQARPAPAPSTNAGRNIPDFTDLFEGLTGKGRK